MRLGSSGLVAAGIGQTVNVNPFGGSMLSLSASQTWQVGGGSLVNVILVSATRPAAVHLGAAGQVLTIQLGGSNDGLSQVAFQSVGLTGASGLTVAASTPALGTGPGAGYVFLAQGPTGTVVPSTATGPLRITCGTLNIGGTGS